MSWVALSLRYCISRVELFIVCCIQEARASLGLNLEYEHMYSIINNSITTIRQYIRDSLFIFCDSINIAIVVATIVACELVGDVGDGNGGSSSSAGPLPGMVPDSKDVRIQEFSESCWYTHTCHEITHMHICNPNGSHSCNTNESRDIIYQKKTTIHKAIPSCKSLYG